MSLRVPSKRLRALVVALCLVGCGTPRALSALRDERVHVGATSAEVVREAGEPALWVAKDGVETLFFKAGKRAVFVALVDDKVVAYDEQPSLPTSATKAAKEARKPVTRGTVRVGMTEEQVRQVLGKPDGLTGEDGLETMHWVAGDSADSIVELRDGKVVGYVDLLTTKFTQNVPRHDRERSTTSGTVRLGMARAQVGTLLGKPDGVSAREGRVVHHYESNPVFGNKLIYAVEYQDDLVAAFSQENVSMAKKERAAQEAAAREAAKEQREGSSGAFGILMNAAVREAVAQRKPPRAAPRGNGQPESGGTASAPSLASCGCPEQTCALSGKTRGAVARVRSCKASCSAPSRPSCSCIGACNAEQGFIRDHVCACQ